MFERFPRSVLFAEAVRVVRWALADKLRMARFEVSVAVSGEDLFRQYQPMEHTLILLGETPDMSPLEILEVMKQRCSPASIIVCDVSPEAEAAVKARYGIPVQRGAPDELIISVMCAEHDRRLRHYRRRTS